MKYFHSIFLFALFFTSECFGQITRSDRSTIAIEGMIDVDSFERFYGVFDSDVKLVRVNSPGGVTQSAIAIGHAIRKHNLDIKVDGVCFSSCANYLFIAANKKYVTKGSVVGWHGGHSDRPIGYGLEEDAYKKNEENLKGEQGLYLKKGVSLDLIIYSGLVTRGEQVGGTVEVILPNGQKITRPKAKHEFNEWVPRKSELERLGVKGIVSFWNFKSAKEVEDSLYAKGFERTRVFTGRAFSYVPAVLRDR